MTQISQMQELDPNQVADRDRLRKFLSDHEPSIDVLLVRSADREILALARQFYSDVLWHNDRLWVLHRRASRDTSTSTRQ